jgi:hypothetical protein
MGKKFNRKVAITIAQAKPGNYFPLAQATGLTNAITVRDLHVRFKIEKTLTEQPNTCEIEILNASPESRAAFQVKPSIMIVEAGYQSDPTRPPELAKIFEGDVMFAASEHPGVDWVTKVTAAEGGRAYARASVNRSYAAGATYAQAISDTAKSMGLKMPSSIAEAKSLSKQFVSGVALTGPSRKQMSKLTSAVGMGWSVQNGQLQLLNAFGVRADEAVVISKKTGMIGQPILGAPKEPGEPVTVKVSTLLEPALLPGGRIKVIAENVEGLFRIDKVSIQCSNFEQDFYSVVEGHMI